jgi:hypothetical protein
MSKKLNITAITNELEGSAFFPGKKPSPLSPIPQPVTRSKPPEEVNADVVITPPIESKPQIPERANATIPERQNGKRIITRNSFEIYEDQMDSLRRLSYQEKMEGKLGSMSGMVRDAIDTYLLKRTSVK